MPSPACWFPLWDKLFMAEERQSYSRPGRDLKNLSGEEPDISENQCSLILGSLNLSSLYLTACIWTPHPWTTSPRIIAQAPEESLWPGTSLNFQVLFHFHSLASKWWQNGVISAWHGAWQPGSTSNARSTFFSQHPSACKVPRWKFVSPAVLWHFYCLIIPLYGNLHHHGPVANETNCHKMLGIS